MIHQHWYTITTKWLTHCTIRFLHHDDDVTNLQAYVEALYHAHFNRWDYRRLTYTWWTSLINDVATSHRIDVLMNRHPLPLATHPYTHLPPTGHEQKGDKFDRLRPLSSSTRSAEGRVDNPEDAVLVPFSRPLVPFSCTTSGGHSSSTKVRNENNIPTTIPIYI